MSRSLHSLGTTPATIRNPENPGGPKGALPSQLTLRQHCLRGHLAGGGHWVPPAGVCVLHPRSCDARVRVRLTPVPGS